MSAHSIVRRERGPAPRKRMKMMMMTTVLNAVSLVRLKGVKVEGTMTHSASDRCPNQPQMRLYL